MGEQGGGTMQVKVAFSAFRDGEVLQYLGLECGAEPFGLGAYCLRGFRV